MKPINYLFYFITLLPCGMKAQRTTAQSYSIAGYVTDSLTDKSITGAFAELLIKGLPASNTKTDNGGHFQLRNSKPVAFQIRITLNGYNTYTSSIKEMNPSIINYNLGKISLLANTNGKPPDNTKPVTPPPAKVIIPTTEFLQQKMKNTSYVLTKGGYTLFYALNPDLKDKTEVPSDHKIVYPTLPQFQPVKRMFKKRFKKDKKRNEPYIYVKNDLHSYFFEGAPVAIS